MFKHMLVATDGSQLSEHAVAYAISIAAPVNAISRFEHGVEHIIPALGATEGIHRHRR